MRFFAGHRMPFSANMPPEPSKVERHQAELTKLVPEEPFSAVDEDPREPGE